MSQRMTPHSKNMCCENVEHCPLWSWSHCHEPTVKGVHTQNQNHWKKTPRQHLIVTSAKLAAEVNGDGILKAC